MAVPRQMTWHTLEAIKGWPSPTALDHAAKLSANVTIDPLYQGRCVHLNLIGEYETGLPATLIATPRINMPLFLFSNSDDPDVKNSGGITGSVNDQPGGWMAAGPSGKLLALPATGSYELETTEFDSSVSYIPGNVLTATNANTDATTGGRIAKVTGNLGSKPVCGIVSKPFATTDRNHNGKAALRFWPYCFPQISDI